MDKPGDDLQGETMKIKLISHSFLYPHPISTAARKKRVPSALLHHVEGMPQISVLK